MTLRADQMRLDRALGKLKSLHVDMRWSQHVPFDARLNFRAQLSISFNYRELDLSCPRKSRKWMVLGSRSTRTSTCFLLILTQELP